MQNITGGKQVKLTSGVGVCLIKAVTEKRSSPELRLANKTKMHLKQQQKKTELKIARGCSIF